MGEGGNCNRIIWYNDSHTTALFKKGELTMRKSCKIKSVLALFLCVTMVFNLLCVSAGAVTAKEVEPPKVVDIVSDKAMYAPGDTATFSISLDNEGSTTWSGSLFLKIFHLENAVALISDLISVEGNSQSTVNMQWTEIGRASCRDRVSSPV